MEPDLADAILVAPPPLRADRRDDMIVCPSYSSTTTTTTPAFPTPTVGCWCCWCSCWCCWCSSRQGGLPACLPACLSNCLPCCSVRWRLFEDDFVRGPVGDPSWGAAAKEGGGKEGRNEGGDSCQRLLPTLRPTNKGFRSSRSAFHALELRSFDFLPFVVNFLYGQGQDSANFLIFLYQQKS